MIDHRFTRNPGWATSQVCLGIGILSTLAGYLLSAEPHLILPAVFVGLAVWLLYSAFQQHADRVIVPSPLEVARRGVAWLVYSQGRLRARWGRFRYGAGTYLGGRLAWRRARS